MTREYFHREGVNGELFVEGVSASEIAAKSDTPVYVYSEGAIQDALSAYQAGLVGLPSLVCVSVKANGNLSLLSLVAKMGAGFDVVSGGELERVVRAGGEPSRAVFAGVGKTDEEIVQALRAGILMFNVESVAELERLNAIASQLGVSAPVALRVNPDVNPKTHPYISTGLLEHKFGVPLKDAAQLYRESSRFSALRFVGVDCHVGSLISDISVFREAFAKVTEFAIACRAITPSIEHLDLGGGLGVPYHRDGSGDKYPSIAEYTGVIREICKASGLRVIIEPGRSIFANSGILLTKVLLIKATEKKQFLVVDAGFNDLIRPILYEAFHAIEPVSLVKGRKRGPVDIVGPICESADCFAHDRDLPEVLAGELIAIFSAGAYGFSMSSNYNSRVRPAEVLVSGKNVKIVRRRETLEELLAPELECLSP